MPEPPEIEAKISQVAAIIVQISEIEFSQTSEQATREMAVNPVIGALGWNTFNPNEVAREFPVPGGRVDYCLRGPLGNLVLIEVKRTGTDLSEHQEQLLRYAFDAGIQLAVLTDGLVWWFYLPMAGVSWEQRRFVRISIRDDAASAASAIHRFLNRDRVVGGSALEAARREFDHQERDRQLRAALQKAWRQLLDDPNSQLRDLLAEMVEKMTGYMPTWEMIADFLEETTGSRSPESKPRIDKNPRPPQPSTIGESTGKTRTRSTPPVAFFLDGKRYEVTNWRMMLLQLCEQLVRDSDPTVFAERVAGLRGRKRAYFSASSAELREPIEIAGTGLYVEGNNNSKTIEQMAKQVVRVMRGSETGFLVELGKPRTP